MTSAAAPHRGVLVGIPGGGRLLYGLLDFLPALEPSAFERQGFERLPPGFNQVQVSRVGRLEDKLPAGRGQVEEQDVHCPVHGQVIQDSVDPLHILRDPLL